MSDRKPEQQRISSVPPFGLRMLPELRQQIEEAARQNARSMNAEIVARLEMSLLPEPEHSTEIIHAFADGAILGVLQSIETMLKLGHHDINDIIRSLKHSLVTRVEEENRNHELVEEVAKLLTRAR